MVTKVLSLATPPEVLELQHGDTCRVVVYFDHLGDEYSGARLYAAIGIRGLIFNEKVASLPVNLEPIPSSPTKTTYQASVDIAITPLIQPGTGFDVYAKLTNLPGADLYSYADNVIEIVEEALPEAEYTLGVNIEPPGAGYVFASPKKTIYPAGEVVTLSVSPYTGYEFDHWGGWPSYPGIGSTSPSIQIAMTADWWVVAVFRAVYVPPPPPPPVYTCPTCGTTFNSQAELDAHIAAVHPPTGQYWYRVTFTDGSVSDIAVPYDPEGNISLWDIVDRDSVLSWVYLGFY